MSVSGGWVDARPLDTEEMLRGLRHRLANAMAPLEVLVELLGDGHGTDQLDTAARRSVEKLSRIVVLLGALGGRGALRPAASATLSVARAGLDQLPAALVSVVSAAEAEWSANATHAGATDASLRWDGECLEWSDNGPGMVDEHLSELGSRQRRGEGGCGLGLAALALVASRHCLLLQAAPGPGGRLRLVPASLRQAE